MSGETERRKSYVSRSVMFPVQIVCWILPGTRSFLNFAGREEAREGMCRSPITRIRTMADDVVRLRFEVEADRSINLRIWAGVKHFTQFRQMGVSKSTPCSCLPLTTRHLAIKSSGYEIRRAL